jgi:hypothetical protein
MHETRNALFPVSESLAKICFYIKQCHVHLFSHCVESKRTEVTYNCIMNMYPRLLTSLVPGALFHVMKSAAVFQGSFLRKLLYHVYIN